MSTPMHEIPYYRPIHDGILIDISYDVDAIRGCAILCGVPVGYTVQAFAVAS